MIPYIETHITEACNLNCRGCSHFSVLAKPKHKDLKEFDREFKRLSDIEQIGVIRLMGGEPLLNPDFMEYVRITRKYFPYTGIALVTNGILGHRLKPYEEELKELDIHVTISDYHLEKQNKEIHTELHEKGQMFNISLDPSGSQDKYSAFFFCELRVNNWFYFMDGKLYPCCIAGTIKDFWNYFGLDWGLHQEEFGIDIFKHDRKEIEEFLSKPIELCRFCDTRRRASTYAPFSVSKKDMREWTV